MPKLRTLCQLVQNSSSSCSSKSDHRPLSPSFFGEPDNYPLTLEPPFFKEPSRCPSVAPFNDLLSGPPFGSHPSAPNATHRPSDPPFSKPIHESLAASSVTKATYSGLISLDKPTLEALTPSSSSEPRPLISLPTHLPQSTRQPLAPHSPSRLILRGDSEALQRIGSHVCILRFT